MSMTAATPFPRSGPALPVPAGSFRRERRADGLKSITASGWAARQMAVLGNAKLVLTILAEFDNPQGDCFPSQSKLAELTGLALSTVNVCLAKLVEAGLISRKRRFHPVTGAPISTQYTLHIGVGLPEPKASALPRYRRKTVDVRPVSGSEFANGAIRQAEYPTPAAGVGGTPPAGDKPLKESLTPYARHDAREAHGAGPSCGTAPGAAEAAPRAMAVRCHEALKADALRAFLLGKRPSVPGDWLGDAELFNRMVADGMVSRAQAEAALSGVSQRRLPTFDPGCGRSTVVGGAVRRVA